MNPSEECQSGNDFIINIHDVDDASMASSQVLDVEQDISLAEVKDFKALENTDSKTDSENDENVEGIVLGNKSDELSNGFGDIEAGLGVKSITTDDIDIKRSDFWKQLADQDKSIDTSSSRSSSTASTMTKIWRPEDVGYRNLLAREPVLDKHFRTKLPDMQVDTRSKDLDLIRKTLARSSSDDSRNSKLDEVHTSSQHIQDVFKGNDTLGRGLQSSVDRLQSLKVPQAVVAFAQAAAKANDLPGWPLLSSSKPQLQKCEKCYREFCSTLNYRRHIRLHRRSAADDKDLRSEKSQLAAFLNKLTTETASEIFSVKNLMIENLSGASAAKSLGVFLQQPGHLAYPLAYTSAGSALLDLVHNKRSCHSNDLMKVLDDASEGTFLCGGTSPAVQRFVYHGEVQKFGLEDKNLVASLSFLVEQKLVKAWMAEKDAEALRCEKALVEEEEAAQRKRAKILEKKRQKKIRQKGSKEKERKLVTSLDSEHEEIQSPRLGEEDDYSLPTGSSSSSVVSSGHDQEGVDDASYLKESGTWDGYQEGTSGIEADDAAEISEGTLFSSTQQETRSNAENLVDHKIGKVLRERRRPNYLSSSSYHHRRDGYFQSGFKARRVPNSTRNESGFQPLYRKKLGGMYRGIVKGGNARAVWTRKVSRTGENEAESSRTEMQVESIISVEQQHQATSPTCSTCSFEEISDSASKDQGSLIVGSLNVPLGNFGKSSSFEDGGSWAIRRIEDEKQPQVVSKSTKPSWSNVPSTKVAPAKVWRAVGKVGEHQEADCRSCLTSDGDDSETQAQNKRSHDDMLAASDYLMTERGVLPNVNVAASSEESVEHSPSPSSTLLASFLSQRWATAVGEECAEAGPFDKPMARSKAVKIWPICDENVSTRVRSVTSTCSKSARRWPQRSSKERHVDQRYMPRRQVFAAQH